MKFIILVIMITLFLPLSVSLAAEQTLYQERLRTSYYHRQNIAPQLFFDERERPTAGILFDINHAIASQLKMKLEMLPIPRKRIQQSLLQNITDMHCAANPNWYKSKELQWSGAIYKNPDMLINSKGITSLTDLRKYKHLKVGTTLGYIYPEISTLVEHENILPIMSNSPMESYEKYRKNLISGFIVPTIESSYLFKEMSDSAVILNENFVYCVFSPQMEKSTVERITSIVEGLKNTGKIQAILNKYKKRPDSL